MVADIESFFSAKNGELKAKNLSRAVISSNREFFPLINRSGKALISFACNDYLGLSKHPLVIEAALDATKKYGAGAGAARLVTGSCPLYEELEWLLAAYHKRQTALVFGSGYLANMGVISALCGKGDLIIADKLIHACMVDGAKLSGAKFLRFRHNDMNHLDALYRNERYNYRNCLILTETVYSMDGDICARFKKPVSETNGINIWLADSAHNLEFDDSTADIISGTLSKTLGSYGGYVCGSSAVIEYLKSSARSFMFSTALPPASLAAANAGLKIIMKEPELLKAPKRNADFFKAILLEKSKNRINIIGDSHIVPIIIGNAERALAASAMLEGEGVYAPAIRPPTVPINSSRLRFSFSAVHTSVQVEKAALAVSRVLERLLPE